MTSRVIAIGDVHGCAIALDTIIQRIGPQADDTIVMLGDCVDRGPDSRGVIEQLLTLKDRCRLVPLLGNHEEMMLNHLDGRPQPDNWLECGGAETLRSYASADGKTAIPDSHVEYLRSWVNWLEDDDHFFVHGSYVADLPFSMQRWNMLRWHSLRNGLPAPHASGKTAVVGHTSQKSGEILDAGHLVCIDTYCWGGGWLTGFEPATGRVWQVNRQGRDRG
jgi:Calcineurin-like phosphoesterase